LCIAIAGCKSKPARNLNISNERKSAPFADPLAKAGGCDSRLQDISGLLLLYQQMNHHLPDSLDQLKSLPGADTVPDFTCPVSGQPYVYNKEGIPSPSHAGRIFVYDSTSAHDGMRLALIIPQAPPGRAVVAQVIALPEGFFKGK